MARQGGEARSPLWRDMILLKHAGVSDRKSIMDGVSPFDALLSIMARHLRVRSHFTLSRAKDMETSVQLKSEYF